jgi:hypothetical protein
MLFPFFLGDLPDALQNHLDFTLGAVFNFASCFRKLFAVISSFSL